MDQIKKQQRYQRLYAQIEPLTQKTENIYARMATIIAILHHKFDYFFWTGFYLLDHGILTVGPYQGAVACLLLEKNKGVCWAGINQGTSIVVKDVEAFPGHIACDCRSKSEVVIPLRNKEGAIIGVLDIDSKDLNAFDEVDAAELEKIVKLIFS